MTTRNMSAAISATRCARGRTLKSRYEVDLRPLERHTPKVPRMAHPTGCTGRQNIVKQCSRGGNASFYKWRSKYGGMDASMISQMKALEDENRRLKKMYAKMSMQAELLKEALGKK
jgi:putative transposase